MQFKKRIYLVKYKICFHSECIVKYIVYIVMYSELNICSILKYYKKIHLNTTSDCYMYYKLL